MTEDTEGKTSMTEDVLILGAKRTPFGKFGGVLKDRYPHELLAHVFFKMMEDIRYHTTSFHVDEIIAGQVLQAGWGQAPARQAAIMAGLPLSCPAVTVRKECASSLYAITDAASHIKAGDSDVVLAGGMENMTRAPYLVPRVGTKIGDKYFHELYPSDAKILMIDSMIHDGLSDIFDGSQPHMGELADRCAATYSISRQEQDEYAVESHRRAHGAHSLSDFKNQIVHIGGTTLDEGVREPNLEKISGLKLAFSQDGTGTVTAANSSQISDGAAGLLLASRKAVNKMKDIQPLARIVAYATHSQDPAWYTTAPVGAISKVLIKAGLNIHDDIDLFEINEAFAVVPIYAMRELTIPHEKVNIWGGAIALGHPIGASGARIVVTLAHALRHTSGRYGLAVACNGGGEAVAIIIENLQR